MRKRKQLLRPDSPYRGRFAPSPTGPLHFGSLTAALGSYLDARHHHGAWLVRIEDLDVPRCVPGAADAILRTLEAFCLYWDETVLYQSRRTAAYEQALHELQLGGWAYPCTCTRKEIADSALHGIEGYVYPGTCRNGPAQPRTTPAWRVRTGNEAITFDDVLQGRFAQHLETEIGDFVIKRADGLFAYQLAVVVDDAFARITHVVRGADLLNSTPRQIYLQHLLGFVTPVYAHLPVAVNEQGEKLSKQTHAAPVDTNDIPGALLRALDFLQQQPPAQLASCRTEDILDWAVKHWDRNRLRGIPRIAAA